MAPAETSETNDTATARPGKRRWPWILGLAATHAGLFAVAVVGFWPAALVALVPLAGLACFSGSRRSILGVVLGTQFLMWMVLHMWVARVTVLGYPLLALYSSTYAVVFVWIIHRMRHHRLFERVPMTLAVPVVWVGLECLRGEIVFGGYGWYLLGQSLLSWPVLVQSADLAGQYLVSLLAAAVSGLVVDLVHPTAAVGSRSRRIAWIGVVIVHLLNIAYGVWRMGDDASLREGPVVLAVQTNLPQSNKIHWSAEEQVRDVMGFCSLTEEAVGDSPDADLVVWPETMMAGAGLEPDTLDALTGIGEDLLAPPLMTLQLARRIETPLLVGSMAWVDPYIVTEDGRRHWAWRSSYNSVYLIDGEPPFQRYDKVMLTPFGEMIPYVSAWPWLERIVMGVAAGGMRFDLDAGSGYRRVELRAREPDEVRGAAGENDVSQPRPITLVTPICFEDTLARYCRRMVYSAKGKAADLIVNLSNDGWFGEFDAARRQHQRAARFRCIENRVPMIRTANTGYTSLFDSCGRVVDLSPVRTSTTMRFEPVLDSRSTVYGRAGNALAWVCLFATALGGVWPGVLSTRRGA